MRYAAAVVMFVLAGAVVLLPTPAAEGPDPNPAREAPPISTCPLVAGSGRSTDVSVLSSVDGPGRLSTFSGGQETGSLEFRTGGSGSMVLDAAEAGAVGLSGGLIEMPTATTAAGVRLIGESARAAESCVDIPSGQSFLAGGSTASGALFELQLLNPYAGEAIAELTVTTDAGIESNERFDAVVVPALSTITLDMSEIIPGREEISVNIEITTGSALAVARQTIDGRTALWRAVEAAQDWWLPIPEGGGTKQLLVASPVSTEVQYQIDYYGAEGLQEAFETGVLQSRGRQRVDLAAISADTASLRVISTAPVVPTLWIDSPAGLALTTASPVDAPSWLLPGAHSPVGGSGTAVILNTGLEDVTVDVRPLGEQSVPRSFDLAAEGVLEVDLVDADGYRVDSTAPVVVLWTSSLGNAGTVAMGVPIQDG